MIFRFDHAFGTGDPQVREILTQARERAFVQEPGKII